MKIPRALLFLQATSLLPSLALAKKEDNRFGFWGLNEDERGQLPSSNHFFGGTDPLATPGRRYTTEEISCQSDSACDDDSNFVFCGEDSLCHDLTCQNFYDFGMTDYTDNTYDRPLQCEPVSQEDLDSIGSFFDPVTYGCYELFGGVVQQLVGDSVLLNYTQKCSVINGRNEFRCYTFDTTTDDYQPFLDAVDQLQCDPTVAVPLFVYAYELAGISKAAAGDEWTTSAASFETNRATASIFTEISRTDEVYVEPGDTNGGDGNGDGDGNGGTTDPNGDGDGTGGTPDPNGDGDDTSAAEVWTFSWLLPLCGAFFVI